MSDRRGQGASQDLLWCPRKAAPGQAGAFRVVGRYSLEVNVAFRSEEGVRGCDHQGISRREGL